MKRLKLLFGTLFLAFAVVASFAFTADDFHAPNAILCFEFTGSPTSGNVLVQSNYTTNTALNCPTPIQRFCAVCINTATNPDYAVYDEVNDQYLLNLEDENVSDAISQGWDDLQEGQNIMGLTFHYRRN